jgi:predicted TIM-barrel fold metal-dependent hydrolase
MTLNQMDHAVLIQHGRPEHGTYDHSYLYECDKRFPGKFNIIVIVDSGKKDSVRKLEEHREKGAVGVRLTTTTRSLGPDRFAIWRKAAEIDMVVSCMGTVEGFSSDQFVELVSEFPKMPIIIEHLAGGGEESAFPRNGKASAAPYSKFKKAM